MKDFLERAASKGFSKILRRSKSSRISKSWIGSLNSVQLPIAGSSIRFFWLIPPASAAHIIESSASIIEFIPNASPGTFIEAMTFEGLW